jgi:hypothetical protein
MGMETTVGIVIGIIVAVSIVLGVIAAVVGSVRGRKDQARLQYALQRAGFPKPDRTGRFDHGKKGIAVDLTARKICFYDSESPIRIFKFSEVSKCELIGINTSGPKPPGGFRVLAGHAIGTALGGFWGGAAGGWFASQTGGRKVKEIGLRVLCDGPERSVHRLLFQDTPCKEGDPAFKLALVVVVPWYAIVNLIIEQNARQKPGRSDSGHAQTNETDEIRFQCEHCGRGIKVSKEHAGRKGRCPACRKIVTVPDPDDAHSVLRQDNPEADDAVGKCSLCMEPMGDTPEKSDSGAAVCVNCKKLLCPRWKGPRGSR